MTTIQVSITAEDIEAAQSARQRRRPHHGHIYHAFCDCPVTRAVQAVVADVRGTGYSDYGYSVYYHSAQMPTPLPATARTFIRDFDAGRAVQPLVFELEVPE
jgi:hypothetical protein